MKFSFIELSLFLLLLIPFSCNGQNDRAGTIAVGGPCEGCEAIFEYGNKQLKPVDTLPHFAETEPKLKISGTVFEKDGKTPAKDVILYIHHTNREGVYPTTGNEEGWGKRHGYIRGWVKTNEGGKYTFYTFRPGSYPNGSNPEHIHLTVKEPGKNEYYVDDFVFEDDPLLNERHRNSFRNRGGSGLMKPVSKKDMLHIERDIILGLNIPNYE